MSGYYSASDHSRHNIPSDPNVDYRKKLCMLKRVIKDLVLENAYLCDEVSQVHEDILTAKEERRYLLKKLQHLEAVAGIDSSLQPLSLGLTASEGQSTQPAPTKKAVKRKAPQESSEEVNGSSHPFKQKSGSRSSAQSKVIKTEEFDVDGIE